MIPPQVTDPEKYFRQSQPSESILLYLFFLNSKARPNRTFRQTEELFRSGEVALSLLGYKLVESFVVVPTYKVR